MKKLLLWLCMALLSATSIDLLATETITYTPGGEFPPDPEDYVACWCYSCSAEPTTQVWGYKERTTTEIDLTPIQVVGDTINCAEDLRCQANDVDKEVVVTIEAGSEYSYSVAHWWQIDAEIDVVDDLLGVTLGCGGENSETFTCTSCVGTQTPVSVHVNASTWDDPKMKWTVYQVDIAIDDFFWIGPIDEWNFNVHTEWHEHGHKKTRSLMGTAVSNVLSTKCISGIECWPGCPVCGTIGSVSGPCKGYDCPNMLCSHH